MTNDNRVSKGVPTGGEFAENNRDEAIINLTGTVRFPALAAFTAARTADPESVERDQHFSYAAIREVITAEYPHATKAVFEWSNESENLRFAHLIDSDGDQIDGSDDMEDLENIASSFSNFRSVRRSHNFVQDESNEDLFTFPVNG